MLVVTVIINTSFSYKMSYLLLALLFVLFLLVNSEILVLFELYRYRYNPVDLLIKNPNISMYNQTNHSSRKVTLYI
jgi:hypothetical protein